MLETYSRENHHAIFCPSILSADFATLGADVAKISEAAHWVHVDVMDGHFVPNLTIGAPVVASLRKHTTLPLDCHLMVEHPENYVEDFAKAGADGMTVHVEACVHLHRVIQQIKAAGMSAGVSLNPATPLSTLEEILPYVDMVLLMSVNPGFGGQKYIPTITDKIRRLRSIIDELGLPVHIQVDGGIGLKNIAEIYAAGADCLVAGSAVFGAEDPVGVLREFGRLCAAEDAAERG